MTAFGVGRSAADGQRRKTQFAALALVLEERLEFVPWRLQDVKAHGLQDAFLGLFDGLTEAINAGKIVAVGVILLALPFDGYGIAIEVHRSSKIIMRGKLAVGRMGLGGDSCESWLTAGGQR